MQRIVLRAHVLQRQYGRLEGRTDGKLENDKMLRCCLKVITT
jgi:hypothetical protein